MISTSGTGVREVDRHGGEARLNVGGGGTALDLADDLAEMAFELGLEGSVAGADAPDSRKRRAPPGHARYPGCLGSYRRSAGRAAPTRAHRDRVHRPSPGLIRDCPRASSSPPRRRSSSRTRAKSRGRKEPAPVFPGELQGIAAAFAAAEIGGPGHGSLDFPGPRPVIHPREMDHGHSEPLSGRTD
jgi:hypothetical protein